MRYLEINIDYYRLQLLTEKAKMIYILALISRNYEVQVKLETVFMLIEDLKNVMRYLQITIDKHSLQKSNISKLIETQT